jgi:hypothetical protein
MNKSSIVSDTWTALGREATSAAEHIAFGVTVLGRASSAQDARYTQAFFALSIGFERCGKLALLVDYALDNRGRFPDPHRIREYGHDLARLLHLMEAIGRKHGVKESLPSTVIHEGIIRTLSEFATNVTRYYNIERVIGDPRAANHDDPIAAWFQRVTKPILAAHYSDRRRHEAERQARIIESLIGDFTSVLHHAETGETIDSVFEGLARTAATQVARRWERVYVLQIARFASEVLIELSHKAHAARLEVPFFSEIFGIFRNDDAYFRSRSTWSIY